MHVVHVYVHVNPHHVDAFREAVCENAGRSVLEPGIARFDVLQAGDDPTRFVLVEIYRTAEDQARHRETEHYLRWRDVVAPMMAEPRSSARFTNIFPADDGF